jgi:hypothetical protein
MLKRGHFKSIGSKGKVANRARGVNNTAAGRRLPGRAQVGKESCAEEAGRRNRKEAQRQKRGLTNACSGAQ